jgi:hypothetical protein
MSTKKSPKKPNYGVPEGKPIKERPIKKPRKPGKNPLSKVYGF